LGAQRNATGPCDLICHGRSATIGRHGLIPTGSHAVTHRRAVQPQPGELLFELYRERDHSR
jgi:hypothetical protein